MQLNYNHLYYFHVAAIEGSVAAAASRLGVTQPTVSEQLRSLERTLGSELFERTQAGLRLTESGRVTFEITSRMFRFGDRLIALMGPREPDLHALRIGISAGLARTTTPDFLLPLVTLEGCIPSSRSGDAVELLRDLRSGSLDLVLCESEPPPATRRGLESVVVRPLDLIAVAPPGVQPAPDWRDVRLLQYRPSSPLRLEVDSFLEFQALEPQIGAEADDAMVLLELAARGGFVAIVPRAIASAAIAAGRVRVLVELDTTAAVHALYRDNLASDLARRAVEVLIQRVGKPEAEA